MAPGTFEALPEPQSFERVLSSMCTEPHPVARQAAERFLATNPGDPASYPSVAELEERAVATLGDVVGVDEPHGYIASGGTEANIQAVRAARNLAATDIPNVLAPESAHFSFEKAASILGVELRLAPVADDYRADPSALAELADQDTALVVGVAGTTEYGRVDPIPQLAEVAEEVDALFHVDAAYGAFLLPFTDHEWHFDHARVDTLTVDPHKMGQAAIPAGGFIVRDPAILDSLAVDTPYLESKSQVTLGGTRSGAGVASAAAVLQAQWPDGYEENYREAMANARWLAGEFEKRGMEVVDPELPIVVTTVSETVFDALREEGWRVARTAAGELRIVCMPHVTRENLRAFLGDLDYHQP